MVRFCIDLERIKKASCPGFSLRSRIKQVPQRGQSEGRRVRPARSVPLAFMPDVSNGKFWVSLLRRRTTKWREETFRVHQLGPGRVKPRFGQVAEPWRITVQLANIRQLCSRC